jgi:tripartite-type tricarboxylate transporter receptor subunit TctC
MQTAFFRAVSWLAATLMLVTASLPTQAQNTTGAPIKLVVAFAPGGSTDLVARTLAEKISRSLGRTVIVENRPGGSGNIGKAYVAQAAPDGLTLLLDGTGPMAISAAAGLKFSYDPFKDLAPVALLTRLPNLVAVNASLPIRSIAELTEYAKANPGKLAYGMSAIGNLSHLNAEMFAQMAGISLTGVPYKGSAPLITDLIGGTVQLSFDNLPPFVPHVKSGKLRALAVTSASRSVLLPEVPSLAELGYAGFDNAALFGIWGPAGLSAEQVQTLGALFLKAVSDPEVGDKLRQSGVEPAPGSAAQLRERMIKERDQFAKVIRSAGIKLEQ